MTEDLKLQLQDAMDDYEGRFEYVQAALEALTNMTEPLEPMKDRLEKGIKKAFNRAKSTIVIFKKLIKKLTGAKQEITFM